MSPGLRRDTSGREPRVYSESLRSSHGASRAPLLELPLTSSRKKSPTLSSAPRYGTKLSVRPRHFLRGVTHDPRGSELGCGPCTAEWPNALLRSGIRSHPVLFLHDQTEVVEACPYSPRRWFRKPLPLAGEGTAQILVCTDVTSTCQFLPSWLRASSGMTQPHSLSRL